MKNEVALKLSPFWPLFFDVTLFILSSKPERKKEKERKMQNLDGSTTSQFGGGGASGEPSQAELVVRQLQQKFQHYLDVLAPQVGLRWGIAAGLLLLYSLRVWLLAGFYIVTYAMGIYLLHLLIGFLSPQDDPDDGPLLPMRDSDEPKGFQRRVPEFKFW